LNRTVVAEMIRKQKVVALTVPEHPALAAPTLNTPNEVTPEQPPVAAVGTDLSIPFSNASVIPKLDPSRSSL
jgi:hypothetical protein